MTKKVRAKNQITKVIINFIPCEEKVDKAAEIYAKAVIKMVNDTHMEINTKSMVQIYEKAADA
ncbi:hypothetical protein [Tepidanaerobacter acetatoxydans]|uniref:hypothetical protein n=1 Tax=Tepidanaerobacter acetatoxydans TaxID=499229 RepID=UPI001BD50DCC|nr:hypothetical protein [Tepidanaerobacter acetatoxydans]